MHENSVPPDDVSGLTDDDFAAFKMEHDILATLEELGHEMIPLGVGDELAAIRHAVQAYRPHIVFNCMEDFYGVNIFDQHVVAYLELLRQPYTGCNPRGMMLTRDKALAKKILTYHRLPVPKFAVFPVGRRIRRPRHLSLPLFVKSTVADSSAGISQASVVYDDEKLQKRVAFIHEQLQTAAIAEQYIDGRELYVGVLGNERLQTFPVWEMVFRNLPEGAPRIATTKVKHDRRYQRKSGITTRRAKGLAEGIDERIAKVCKRVYRALDMSGYARMDLRLTEDGRVYILEANPNPDLSYGEDFAESAHAAGVPYDRLIHRILSLGLRYRAQGVVDGYSASPSLP
jgi:D-alanine-D-alanine ligase